MLLDLIFVGVLCAAFAFVLNQVFFKKSPCPEWLSALLAVAIAIACISISSLSKGRSAAGFPLTGVIVFWGVLNRKKKGSEVLSFFSAMVLPRQGPRDGSPGIEPSPKPESQPQVLYGEQSGQSPVEDQKPESEEKPEFVLPGRFMALRWKAPLIATWILSLTGAFYLGRSYSLGQGKAAQIECIMEMWGRPLTFFEYKFVKKNKEDPEGVRAWMLERTHPTYDPVAGKAILVAVIQEVYLMLLGWTTERTLFCRYGNLDNRIFDRQSARIQGINMSYGRSIYRTQPRLISRVCLAMDTLSNHFGGGKRPPNESHDQSIACYFKNCLRDSQIDSQHPNDAIRVVYSRDGMRAGLEWWGP